LFQNSTFFDPHDLLQVKYEMVRHVLTDGVSKTKAANLFGVSRPTVYEAESAFIQSGLQGLLPHQRGPKKAHKLDVIVMDFIETQRTKEPKITIVKLADLVQENFNVVIHPRSIARAIAHKKKQQTPKIA
jgi:transposase